MAEERGAGARRGEVALSTAQNNLLPLPAIPPVRLSLHPRLSAELRGRLRTALEGAGVKVVSEGSVLGSVVPIEHWGELDGAGARIALFDGRLKPEHAELLRAHPSTLLLACRQEGLPSPWELRALTVALGTAPLFAASPHPPVGFRVGRVDELHAMAREAADAVRAAGGKSAPAGMAADVMHELAANALLDAPVDEQGAPKYAHRRGEELEIAPSDACRATVAIADGRVYLSVTDVFGRLTAAPIAAAVAGLGGKSQLNPSGGGAGLGLRRILEQSELFVARVRPGSVSEVVCVVDLGDNRRRANGLKSLFFTVAGA